MRKKILLDNQDINVGLAQADAVFNAVDKITAQGQPFETCLKEINNIDYVAFAALPENLHQIYRAAADTYGDNEFLVYQDKRISFIDLYQQASCFAYALVYEYGVKKGDKIAIGMRNYPEWIIAFMAITSIGAIAVPLNCWWQKDEFLYALKHSETSVFIADKERYLLLENYLNDLEIKTITAKYKTNTMVNSMNALITNHQGKAMPEVKVSGIDLATIFYTSGSTGHPKGAVSRHINILSAINTWLMLGTAAAIANDVAEVPPDYPPVALMTVPLFHVTGCHTLFLLSMISGRKTIMMEKWDAGEALRLIEKEKVTYFNGVPTMSMELLAHPERDKYNLDSLSDICAGGAKRPPKQVRDIYESFEGNPSTGYGLTETNALGSVNGAGDYVYRPSSAGMATKPIVQVKIINEQCDSLKNGAIGEICIKAVSNIAGYWKNPKATEEAFTDDGYFKTGDLGYLDEAGFIYIVDRAKDIIIRGGENISCLEVESALYCHELVKEVSVFAVPDERLGEAVAAAIYSKSDKLTSEEIKESLADKLAPFKKPEKIILLSEPLPKLGSGKIDKKKLKQIYA